MSIISLSILLGLQFVSIAYGFGIQPRIINGIKGNNADFPFFAVVQEGEGDCGGVLISDRYSSVILRYLLMGKQLILL